jgi:CHAT domain-containing protein
MHEVQEWIWDVIAEPVFETLGTPAPQRLWWCPIGLLSYLPLHAAERGDQSVLDRVVSSYTPTIRALSYARANRRQSATQVKTLVVGIPHIPNSDPLPGVEAEIKSIKRLIPGSLVLSEKEATREVVLKALPFSNLTHFACHAKSEWSDPSLSRLLLHDDSSGPLTVRDISRLQLSDAQLAFLSACSTAQAGPAFADEVAHITAAFQIAGFQQVIGTLWEVADLVAVRLTKLVYEQLTEDGTVVPALDRAAYALHHAVRQLRKSYPGEPQYWAGFVHVGV